MSSDNSKVHQMCCLKLNNRIHSQVAIFVHLPIIVQLGLSFKSKSKVWTKAEL